MFSFKKYILLFTVAFIAFNSAIVCADVSDDRAVNKRRCSVNADHIQSLNHAKGCRTSPSTDVSWTAWLTGDSRSNQFHYLDLLELLFRDDQSTESRPRVYESNR